MLFFWTPFLLIVVSLGGHLSVGGPVSSVSYSVPSRRRRRALLLMVPFPSFRSLFPIPFFPFTRGRTFPRRSIPTYLLVARLQAP